MTQDSISQEARNELENAMANLIARLQPAFKYRVGLLGDGNGNLKGSRPDYWIVRMLSNQSNRIEVFGRRVSGGEGTPVIVGKLPWEPNLEQIIDVDWGAYANANLWSATQSYLPQHGFTHISYGTDPAAIDKGNLVPLHTHVTSGSVITALADYYPFQDARHYWPGGSVSAGPYMTGTSHFITAYIEPVTNTLHLMSGPNITGSTAPYASFFTPTPELVNAYFPTPAVGSVICGTFLWLSGNTDIKSYHTFPDRLIWHPVGGIAGVVVRTIGVTSAVSGDVTLTGSPDIAITQFGDNFTFGLTNTTPKITDTVTLTGQVADITATALPNASSAAALYRVSIYAICTTADAGAGTVTVTIGWNDGTAARTQATAGLNLAATNLDSSTILARRGSGNLTYTVTHSGSYGSAVYSLRISVEKLF